MYFVTTKRAGYLLFCTTANEVAAIGLTEQQNVQVLGADAASGWKVLLEWPASKYSHTEFMAALHDVEEPSNAQQLLTAVPAPLR